MTSTLAAGIVIPVPGAWVPFILGAIALAIIAAFVWDAGKWIGRLGKKGTGSADKPTPPAARANPPEPTKDGLAYGITREPPRPPHSPDE